MEGNQALKRWTLYVLGLKNNKYYVGITTKSPEERFNEHVYNVRAAAWTRKHRPTDLLASKYLGELCELEAKAREDIVTLELMRRHGVNNVRGGSYCQIDDYVTFMERFYTKDTWEGMKIAFVLMGIILLLLIVIIYK